jgi:tetratricopeptide (TPR) repeat protein
MTTPKAHCSPVRLLPIKNDLHGYAFMKTLRLLAAALLSAGLLNIAAAQVSASVAKPLKEASELLHAGKAREALAKLNGVTGTGPNDQYMIYRMKGAAYQKLGDNVAAAQALESAVGTGKVPATEAGQVAVSIAAAYAQAGNHPKAQQWIEKAKAAGDNSQALRELQAYEQASSGDYATIARDASASIQAAENAGRKPAENDLLRLADAYRHTGNKAGDLQVKEKLVLNYPTTQYTGIYLSDLQGKPGFSSRYALDLMRLRLATGNITTAADYMELSQLLLQTGMATEAKAVVDKGYAAGVLGTGAEAARQQRLRDLANHSTEEEKASIAKRTADAAAQKDGNALVQVGMEYASMGEYDKGIELIQQGIAKDTLKHPEDAKLRLGVAMMQSGKNRQKAVAQLRSVQGADGAPEVARMYSVILAK